MAGLGTIAGTPLYLSPEAIARPDGVDGRSDLYALGAVGYFYGGRLSALRARVHPASEGVTGLPTLSVDLAGRLATFDNLGSEPNQAKPHPPR